MAKPLVEKELELAEEILNDADILLNAGGSPRSIMNRVYYSVFHASRAALIGLGLEPKTHKVYFGQRSLKRAYALKSQQNFWQRHFKGEKKQITNH